MYVSYLEIEHLAGESNYISLYCDRDSQVEYFDF